MAQDIKKVTEHAQAAWASGQLVYVAKVDHGGTVTSFVGSARQVAGDDSAGVIEAIESVGWREQSSGYVFVTKEHQKSFLGGASHVSGSIIGIYVFRRA